MKSFSTQLAKATSKTILSSASAPILSTFLVFMCMFTLISDVKADVATPTSVFGNYNATTDVLTITVNWDWDDPNDKALSVAVFADLNGDGFTPGPTDNPATWTSGGNLVAGSTAAKNEFLGQLASSTIEGLAMPFGDGTDAGIASGLAGFTTNTPRVLFPFGLDDAKNPPLASTFTLTYSGVTSLPAHICVVLYDVHTIEVSGMKQVEDLTGQHSPKSAGPGYNSDNSTENGYNGNVSCTDPEGSIDFGNADLRLTKSVNNHNPSVGGIITFTIKVMNDGPDDATGVKVTDVLPAGVVYVAGSISGPGTKIDADPSGTGLMWTNMSIPNGGMVTLTFDATITGSGTIVNYAQIISADQEDPDSEAGNNQQTPDEDDDNSVNINVSTCNGGVMADIIPPSASICGGDFNPIMLDGNPTGGTTPYMHAWTGNGVPFLNNTNTQTPEFTSNGVPGVYTLTYTVTDNNGCTASDLVEITVEESPTLDLTTDGPANANCGELVTYTVSVSNSFMDFTSLQYSLNWDPTKLAFVSYSALAIGGDAPTVYTANTSIGEIAYSWFEMTGITGEDLSDNTVILTVVMQVIATSGSYAVSVTDSPVVGEIFTPNLCLGTPTYYNMASTDLSPITITLGTIDPICPGTTTTTLSYSATTGNPDLYSIDFDAAAEAEGFVDVVNAPLPASPITIIVPANAACAVYNAEFSIKKNGSDCTSSYNISIPVEDNIAPVLNCPTGDVMVPNDVDKCTAIAVWPAPTVTDNCGATISQTAGPVSGTMLNIGSYTVSYSAEDGCGNMDDCTFNVLVMDMQTPTAVCQDITISLDANGVATIVAADIDGGSSDNCGNITLSIANGAFGCADLGDNNVTLTVSDNATPPTVSTCVATVTVEDNIAPTIDCPADIAVNNDPGDCGAVVNYNLPAIDDNCPVSDGSAQTANFNFNGAIQQWTVPAGVTQINIKAIGAAGGGAGGRGASIEGTFTVTPGHVLNILVGGQGENGDCSSGGGGGGTFVWDVTASTLLSAAGGGGGGGGGFWGEVAGDGSSTTTPTTGVSNSGNGAGGVGGNGGDGGSDPAPQTNACGPGTGGGGGGWLSDGMMGASGVADNGNIFSQAPGGLSPMNGGAGGSVCILGTSTCGTGICAAGGFGGGGAGIGSCGAGGGGGGYNGGGGGNMWSFPADPYSWGVGGGGGSFNGGINQNNIAGLNAGDGMAVISYSTTQNLVQTAGLPSGATFPVGTTTNVFVVTDNAGNTASCSFDVVVTDTENPSASCPSNATITTSNLGTTGDCFGQYSWNHPNASDNCGIDAFDFTYTNPNGTIDGPFDGDQIESGNISGVVNRNFAVGTTTITYHVEDVNGNNTTCAFTVTVTDNEDPAFTNCPANISVGNDVDVCGSNVFWTAPSATDNCSVTVSQTSGLAPGSVFPVGTSTIVYTAVDPAGNDVTCQFTIKVTDEQAPTLNCAGSGDIVEVFTNDGNCSHTVGGNGLNATTTDNCPGVTLVNDFTNTNTLNGAVLPAGITWIEWTATDAAGNITTCRYRIRVSDDDRPDLTCPPSLTAQCSAGDQPAYANLNQFQNAGGIATDNCNIANGTFVLESETDNGQSCPMTVTRVYRVSDQAGNFRTCSQTITVDDTTLPTISAPADITLSCVPDQQDNQAAVTDWLDNYTVSDNCDVDVQVTHDFNNTLIDYCTGNDIVVTWTATDDCGNTRTTSATIVVNQDVTAPSLTAPVNLTISCVQDQQDNQAAITDWLDNYTATDGCDSEVSVTHNFSATTIDYCTGNDLVVTWTATDDCGNSTTKSATIEVNQDVTAPSLTAPSNLTISCVQDQQDNQAAITTWLDNYTASDNCDSEVSVTNSFNATTIDYCTGNDIVVTWTATDDCGNSTTKSATIEVNQDVTAPALTAPANLTISCVQDQQDNQAAITDWLDNYTATDGCDSEVSVTHNFSATTIDYCTGNDLVVTWTATDDCGNSTTKSATIVVNQDVTAPSLTAPANLTLSCVQDQQDNQAAITTWLDNYTATDGCDSEVSVTNSFNATTIDYCTGNDIVVTWTATDDCGNSTTKSATIEVNKDLTAPTLTAPANLTISCVQDQQDNQAAITTWLDNYTASDNCDSEVSVTNSFSATTIDYCTGNDIVVTWTATDDCGNTKTASATIEVTKDVTAPTLNTPANLSIACVQDQQDNVLAILDWLNEATATDGCDSEVSITYDFDDTLIDYCDAGGDDGYDDDDDDGDDDDKHYDDGNGNNIIVVTWTATDDCGNTKTKSANIVIEQDLTKPEITAPANLTLNCVQDQQDNQAAITTWLDNYTVSDNCDSEVTVTNSFSATTIDYCTGADITVTWTATDDCGNTKTASAKIVVNQDVTAPNLTAPANLTLNCVQDQQDNQAAITTWLDNYTASDNCDSEVSVTNSFSATTIDYCTGNDIVVTWTATDDCGNTKTASATIVVNQDVTAPSLTAPANLTLSCVQDQQDNQAAITDWLDNYTATDGCDSEVSVTHNFSATTIDYCTGADLVVTWTATDDCGNSTTKSATIVVNQDVTAPSLTAPANLTISCVQDQQDNQAAITTWLDNYTATDGCDSEVTVTNSFSATTIDYCTGNDIVVTWTATDDCGNSTTKSATIEVNKDITAPTLTAPANLTISCVQDQQDNQAAITTWLDNYTASDNCDSEVSVTNSFSATTIDYCTGNDIVVTWTATDDCGNTKTASATIEVTKDVTAPTLNTPANLSIACVQDQQDNVLAILDWLNEATATDGCDSEVTITYDFDDTLIDYCDAGDDDGYDDDDDDGDDDDKHYDDGNGNNIIVVTWTATDDCGNTKTKSANIVIEQDKTKPEITLPSNLTIACVQDQQDNVLAILDWLNEATATDGCDSEVALTYDFDDTLIDYCDAGDDDGYHDGDDDGDDDDKHYDDGNGNNIIVVTWTATDDCGNTKTKSANIVVTQDKTKPELDAPANLTLNCVQDQQDNQAAITTWLDNYTVSDNCDSEVTVTNSFSATTIDYCTGADLVVTWTATDDCGNTKTASATIVVNQDVTAPSLTAPANLTLNCVQDQQDNQAAITTWLDNYTTSDNCDSEVSVTNSFSATTIDYCTGNDIVVTWTATDDCGNTKTASATIVVNQDVTAPSLTAPANLTLNCVQDQQDNQAAITTWLDNYTVTDGCDSEVTVTNSFSATTIDYCTGNDLVVTWTATDDCGNSTTKSATIVVNQDVTAPSVSVPSNLTIACVQDQQDNVLAILDWLNEATATDGCDSEVTLTYDFDDTLIDYCDAGDDDGYHDGDDDGDDDDKHYDDGNGNNIIVVTWTATDDCGNTKTKSANIVVTQDKTKPELDAPANLTLNCVQDQQDNQAAITDWLDNYTVSDNCDSEVSVTHNFSATTIDYCTGADITVTWTATDDCGNTKTASAKIVVNQDVTAPNLTAPSNLTLSCVQDQQDNQAAITTWLDNYTATDNCDSEVSVTNSFSATTIDYCTGNDIVVTWTATDDCGNTKTASATIVINQDVTVPSLTAPANLTLSCVQDQQDNQAAITDWLDNYVATDNCDSEVSVTHNFSATTISYCAGDDIVVTWTATDDCGNTSTKSATIVINPDVTAPELSAPANLTLSCVQDQQDNQAAITDWLDNYTTSDNCDSEVTVTHNFSATTISYCTGDDLVVTWTATDDCGNTTTKSATIVINPDVTAPELSAPANLTLSCVQDQQDNQAAITDWLDNYTVSDGCDSEVTVTHNFSATTISYCTGDDLVVTWTATDDCGNSTTKSATIVINPDVTAPVITAPANLTISCLPNTQDNVAAVIDWIDNYTANDGCDSEVTVTHNFSTGLIDYCTGDDITVTWTAVDDCGNSATATALLVVDKDLTAPTFVDCPADITFNNDVDKCGTNTTWPIPSAIDGCGNVSVVQTDGPVQGSLLLVGTTYTIVYTATDACGNTATCEFTIDVMDMQTPTAVCNDITVDLSSDINAGAVTVLASQIAGGSSDNCSEVTLSPASVDFTCANVGDNNVTVTVTDESENTSICVATITVRDVTPPTFTCPAPVTVDGCNDLVPDVITGIIDEADNCGVLSTVQDPVAGLDFGQISGNSVDITVTVTDVNGNVSTCVVPVTIDDDDNPDFLNCPVVMIMIGNDPDQCSGKVNWQPPVAVDDCLPLPISAPGIPLPGTVVQIGGPLPGTAVAITCPPTPTTITYQATDGSGNTAICSFEIMVVDTEKPEFDADITMPNDTTVNCHQVPSNCVYHGPLVCTPLTNNDVNDNCTASADLDIEYTEESTQCDDPGQCCYYTYDLTRTWTITDCAGNSLVHVQNIHVQDTTAPVALCKNATIQLDKTGKVILDPQLVNNGSYDNCAAFPYLTFAVVPNQFTCANLGPNQVTLSVTDPCGNVGTCTATVIVEEGIAPCTPEFDVQTTCVGNTGNATNLDNGQFMDVITIKSLAMQTWILTANVSNNGQGLYLQTSPAPPASPILIPVGTLFKAGNADGLDNDGDNQVDEADEMIYYTLIGLHVDCRGYNITASNVGGIGMGLSATTTQIENKACYPTPYFCNLIDDPFCLGTPPFTIEVCEFNNAAGSVVPGSIMVDGVVTTIFDASALGVGSHTVMATFDAGAPTTNLVIDGVQLGGTMADAIADPGCRQKITQIVHVVETPTTLVCNDLVIVSMDEDCKITVEVDDVLEGTYYCYDDYLVEVDKTLPFGNGPWVMAMFDASDIGKTYFYHVTHTTGGPNICWGEIKIEDKLAPILDCPADISIACSESTDPSHTGQINVSDCSAYTTVIDDEYSDFGQCSDPRGLLFRTWIVTDAWGNQSSCSQAVTIIPFDLQSVVWPDDAVVDCEDTYLNPQGIASINTGEPTINGASIVGSTWCGAQVGYTDTYYYGCGGTFTILRVWGVLNNCVQIGAGNPISHTQRIQVIDLGGPAFNCPTAVTVSTDPFSCCSTAALPDMIVSEGCSHIVGLEAKVTGTNPNNGNIITFTVGGHLEDFPGNNYWNPDTMAVFDYTQCLPLGTYNVRYKASDDCGNTSYCNFELTVADLIPPVASCDQTTVVGVNGDDPADCYTPADGCDGAGVTWVKATTFDDHSTDNCHPIKMTVRRMAPYSDCINNLSHDPCYPGDVSEFDLATAELDSIKFYCCEVGTTQTVILRVYQVDLNGNFVPGVDGTPLFNECMVQVEVQDKIKPVCQAPANVTVTCEQFDPSLWLYGKAEVLDNCCLDTTKVYQEQCGLTHAVNYSQFDTLCNKGTITRTFRAFDCHGQSSQCTQRIVVNYEQDYFVRFPNDVIVTTCDGSGNYGEPTFFGKDCELLGVTFEDAIFTVVPDACFKIERNWKIINWCTYLPNQPCINVPNPNPNAIENHPTNLPGPIVSPIQTVGDPWKSTIVKLNPNDATPTNYSVYYDPNANCYTYKQIIKIIDTQDPIVECPASPVTVCDLTPNDPQLWNLSYWWDNSNQSHDLCEAPTDIFLAATDACSGANINFEYQLFLDLDGDGVMETVVNSTQLGSQPGGLGWNNILFGNASGAGESRQFDGRPVPPNQKWGFAIQEIVDGNKKTAYVKFNTFQSQSTYVTPQLPHGVHKIKWFVTDGCGNETICEYTIVIKDCKAPSVVCLNGLSVNIMPTGMIQLWATDFLQYAEDNCTLNPYLKYGIRKCGSGTGFPLDAQGNPITNVAFTCDELGTQCVELWAIDLAGNADYCETYVIVQDNAGNCGVDGTVNVSGALKTEISEGVEEATVDIAGADDQGIQFIYSDVTDNQGLYAVNGLVPLAADFTITPLKDDNPLNGVTTYDLVLISKHILGIEPLGSPYRMIAADANKSNSITTFDIVEIRKLILGIYNELPNNTSWRFVDKAYVFPNPANPFMGPIPENISIADVLTNQLDQNFVGVKIGDVNNTVTANSLMTADDRMENTLLFDVTDRTVKAGEEFEVTFNAADDVQGYQMTLNLNGLAVAELENSDNVTANNFGVFADALTVSIDGADAFTVKFRATKSGKLSQMLGVSSRITKAESYSRDNKRMDVALRFDGKTVAGVGFELYQNEPNPFVSKTFVGFHLPEATAATLTVYDETGRVVYTQKGDFAKGYNSITLDRALLNTTGVLYYTLETATDAATKKMIQAK